ncbi:DUF3592 domain-containing protein [Amycolatopsis mongoliensis]|uniref:DUF3592 domain-containing protein n=1 Tax=Amycolatopsis mongoliensis TaxID=715475 RepID=A0A9Y2JS59_9PSEU|nr:DUF3592 domain-containing protein [Amycolatopsis sp. 4-36]WIY01969.1 DUF3592 domain-containing protein [Amycolatopsis sp. 4-36]
MTLGTDRDATTHRRWQNTFLAGAIVFGLAALGDAAGTVYALTAPGYVFEDGELTGEIMVFVLAAALMLGCAGLGRWLDRRRAALVAEHEHWLPALTERNGAGQVDLDVETARLRLLVLRSVGLVLVWMAVLAGVVAGFVAMSASADHLLKTGTRVTGEVLGVYKHSRDDDTIYVAYPVDYGHYRYADIVWDSGRQYTEGQQITVIYDKADPDRVRTLDETNSDQTWVWAQVIGTIAGMSGLVLSVIAAMNWRRRSRAVRATGWRIASVTVEPDYPIRRGRHLPDINVVYRDGTRITLRAATSSHGSVPMKHQPNRQAWIGGTDRDMVVLFPHGRWRKSPYAVPAYALNMRTGAKNTAAPVPEDPEQTALVKRKVRRFVIVMAGWYAVLIAAGVVLMVLNLLWPLFFVAVVGSLAPIPLTQVYFTRMRAALEEK